MPATVFFMAPGPLRAGVVEQALTDILPDRVRTVEPGGVRLLDLDGPGAAAAANHQNILRSFAQPRSDTCWAWARRTRVGAGGRPAAPASIPAADPRREPVRAGGAFLPAAAGIFSICAGVGMRQFAGQSVMSN